MRNTGKIVAANIRLHRGAMQYKELAEKLDSIGRPIPTLGLRRIEKLERRVDVDDLEAFAVVFGVPAHSLLIPNTIAPRSQP